MSLITREGLIPASALGGGVSPGPGPAPGPQWPFIMPYDYLVETSDDAPVNYHEDLTGGASWAKTSRVTLINTSDPGAVQISITGIYGSSAEAYMMFNYRLDFTNIAKIRIAGYGSTNNGNVRWTTSDNPIAGSGGSNWTSAGYLPTASAGILDIDTSGITGFKYFAVCFRLTASSDCKFTIKSLSVIPGPYLYRLGDEAVGLTGGWWECPAAHSAEVIITNDVDHFHIEYAQGSGGLSGSYQGLTIREMIDFTNVTAIEVYMKASDYISQWLRFFFLDESYASVAYVREGPTYRNSWAVVTFTLPAEARGRRYLNMGSQQAAGSRGYTMDVQYIKLIYGT